MDALICPACHRVDVDFARLGGTRLRCFACRAVVDIQEKRLVPNAPGGGAVELHGTVLDTRASLANQSAGMWTEVEDDFENSFPVDLYVSDDGCVCIRKLERGGYAVPDAS